MLAQSWVCVLITFLTPLMTNINGVKEVIGIHTLDCLNIWICLFATWPRPWVCVHVCVEKGMGGGACVLERGRERESDDEREKERERGAEQADIHRHPHNHTNALVCACVFVFMCFCACACHLPQHSPNALQEPFESYMCVYVCVCARMCVCVSVCVFVCVFMSVSVTWIATTFSKCPSRTIRISYVCVCVCVCARVCVCVSVCVCVKSGLVCVKSALVCVKSALVCVKSDEFCIWDTEGIQPALLFHKVFDLNHSADRVYTIGTEGFITCDGNLLYQSYIHGRPSG